jgi:hypothetical protein
LPTTTTITAAGIGDGRDQSQKWFHGLLSLFAPQLMGP